MSTNIEIKAYVKNYQLTLDKIIEITAQQPTQLRQFDTFFKCNDGRLKLRRFSEAKGELIFYNRSDEPGPNVSSYLIVPTSSPSQLARTLESAYGLLGHVEKQRLLFLSGRTRIHLDKVKELGDFIELEVVLEENESIQNGIDEANQLMKILNINSTDLIRHAYVDLINKGQPETQADNKI